MSNKVLIIVGDASETMDTLYPIYRLQEADFVPVIAAPEKRKYQMVLHEVKRGWTITKEWEGYSIDADVAFSDVLPDDYAGIFFSGGRAPEYIRYDEHLVEITKHFFAAEKTDLFGLPRCGDSRICGMCRGTANGYRAQMPIRPGGLRRCVRQ